MKKMLVSTAAVLLLSIGTANAVDPPEQKEGLWSTHMQTVDNPGNKKTDTTSTICRSHAYDQYVLSLMKTGPAKGCSTFKESLQAGKYSIEGHCTVAGTVVDTKGTATFQGDTSAHSESHATYTPPLGGLSDTTTIMDQKYIGSCPAGAQPGDLTHADGRVTHLWKH